AVMEKAVTTLHHRMVLENRLTHQVRPYKRMVWQALGCSQQATIGSENDARKVMRGIEDAGTGRAKNGVLHFPGNRFHTVRYDCHLDAIGRLRFLQIAHD